MSGDPANGDATAPRGGDESRARYIGGANRTDGAVKVEEDLKARLMEAHATIIDLQAQMAVMNAMVINLTRHYVTSHPKEMQEATLQRMQGVLANLSMKIDHPDPDIQRHIDQVNKQIPKHANALLHQVAAQLKARN